MIKLDRVTEITQDLVHCMPFEIEAVIYIRVDTPNIEKLFVYCVLLCLSLSIIIVL